MKITGRGWLFLLAMMVVAVAACTSSSAYDALRVSDSQIIGFDRLIEEVRGARLIFIGEDHSHQASHYVQLDAIRRLKEAGTPIAIGLEMFTAGSQEELDRWVAGRLELEDFIRLYYREWHMPWRHYRDILLYARDNRIPLLGLNVPRSITRKVAQE